MVKALIAGLFLFLAGVPIAQAQCRQALVLGVDVSGSVDVSEYRLQLSGIAQALRDEAVQAVILSTPDYPIAFSVFEWSARDYQKIIIDWTRLTSTEKIEQVARALEAHQRGPTPQNTSISGALAFAAHHLKREHCPKKVFDISGDGENNHWIRPSKMRQHPDFKDIEINALVIGSENSKESQTASKALNKLVTYFRAEVIHGPSAFIETAESYADYAKAMQRKLLRELTLLSAKL